MRTLVAAALMIGLVGCGDGSGGGGGSTTDGGGSGGGAVASVAVTAPSSSVAVGETLQLTAVAKDAAGRVVAPVSVQWSATPADVATVDTAGLLTGLTAGSSSVVASVGSVSSPAFMVSVVVPPPAPVALTLVTAALPPATAGSPYTFTFQAAGGTPPYTWAAGLISPDGQGDGLTLDPATGVLSGTPTFSGNLPVLVEVADAELARAWAQLLLRVGGAGAGRSFTNAPAAAAQGSSYSYNFGVPWSSNLGCNVGLWQAWGKVPPGLSLNTLSGTLTGTPLSAGVYTFGFWADAATTLCIGAPTQTNLTTFTLEVAPSASAVRGASNWRRDTAPVLEATPGAWDSDFVTAPSVVKVGGTYYLFYEGQGGPEHRRAIGLATSSDGKTFTKHAQNPIFAAGRPGKWDAMEARIPVVHHDGTLFRMWYFARPNPSDRGAIGFASSSDGIVWTRHPQPVFGSSGGYSDGTAPGQVLRAGSTFTLFYVNQFGRFGRATSSDGIAWSDQGALSYDVTPSHSFTRPSVLDDAGTLRMWYMRRGDAISNQALGSGSPRRIGGGMLAEPWSANSIASASSSDGSTWTLFEGNPVFVGSAGWDGPGVAYPSVMLDGGVFKMWYAGGAVLDGSAKGAIGFATIP